MTPPEAITRLPEMQRELNRMRALMHDEMDEIIEQWDQLGRMGGQRDDHAAGLLGRLRPHLENLADFATKCVTQINGMIADPFGTKQEAQT
jgi:hypothetical protein